MRPFILLLRNESIDIGSYSPEDMQKIMSDFDEWNAKMIGKGRLIAGGSLQGGEGKTLRLGNVIADGPYSELREAVSGLLLIQAADLDEATGIARGCPFLPRGGSVEVRPIPEFEFEDAARPVMEAHARVRTERMQEEA